jgi:phosphoglycolate phosphatase-like HAD superfamily hydrolase
MDSKKTSFDLFDFINFRRRVFVALLKKHLPRKLWFSDSKEFLFSASKKYPLALITGSRHMFVNEVFDKKTKNCFKTIITSDDVEHKKPDIEPLLVTLKKFKLKAKDVVFIGDSIQDGLMCQRLGVDFIAKNTGISTENELRKFGPIFVTESFKDIENFLGIE